MEFREPKSLRIIALGDTDMDGEASIYLYISTFKYFL